VTTYSKEPKWASNVNDNHSKSKIYLCFAISNHGNHGKLLLFDSYEYQETQIKSSFDPILDLCFNLKHLKMNAHGKKN
jgi:hypothetical protein